MTNIYPRPEKLLPHSHPFIYVDKIVEYEKGKYITCIKNVTINEEIFRGHFKDNPLMPGVLIIEAMVQASGLIIGNEGDKAYLTRIKDARFKQSVVPGDQLIIKSFLIHTLHPLYVFDVTALVEEQEVTKTEITLTII